MDQDKIVSLIEQELVQADQASNHHDFEKHMYAIHTLTSIFVTSDNAKQNSGSVVSRSKNQVAETVQYQDISAAEIKAMGGTVPSNYSTTSKSNNQSNLMITDDEIGNGESIFDF
ncbi:DUF5327 family protein [Staphylococcus simiae]|uniref:DUF5327 family protein n=1 Tax=Staphylococcus simiae TaxID=308354 RepID=UPI001A970E3A|nr:DUF5327 family protein [Staphylococcus simiae]MBO1199259.1 DUF5327 family protein [Staphylococcus simiae]MBO1201459.1 DUF5327 family protein [Staphylococcus simiae]MBO1203572.1 DUF5327 family protein [Staphylococcus simiae]MBO1211230.1 DUF5327 family protein [Staphylococcus simiae]MBO1229806.1 DUF5327 family protein [Staphylococcus simiae]